MKKQLLMVTFVGLLFCVFVYFNSTPDIPGIIEQSMKSVVMVFSEDTDEYPVASGFYIGGRIIVTAGHVAEESNKISYVEFEDGTVCKVVDTIRNPDYDCGFLIIEPIDKPALKFDTEPVVRGEVLLTMGNPHAGRGVWGFTVRFNVSKGIVSGFVYSDLSPNIELFVCDGVAHPGNSGSPLIDEEGEVKGLHVAGGRSFCGSALHGFSMNIKVADILRALEAAGLERR